ncbi:MAG: hypothetical protein NZ772_02150 [Cyanobacteria bacterium]|nr:hypothetical protein [Cyanobacteriota bacterium]MDW8199649.1 hypothetical protein [Cyanobacteriota bacterium SKYGB_h_bin112]
MAATLNPRLMDAVEKLDYRVTIADVASAVGLRVDQAEKELQVLAAETGGIFQVAETGDLVYVFPKNFQAMLRAKYLRLRLMAAGKQAWRVVFYLIRLSVGIVLILLIVAIVIAIVAAMIAIMTSSKDGNDRGGSGRGDSGRGLGMPSIDFFYIPNFGRWFLPDYDSYDSDRYNRRDYSPTRYQGRDRTTYQSQQSGSDLNFFEVFFSFLFGDGIPNVNLEERRWAAIAATIRNNGGAVTAEMIAPYLDDLGNQDDRQEEAYMLPVMVRFDGRPEVTADGDIIYVFPQMQATASSKPQPVAAYLKEDLWQFSRASSGQLWMAGGFGVALFVLSLVLFGLLQDPAVSLPAIVNMLPWAGLGYSVLYLAIPAIRYGWLQWRNSLIAERNRKRQNRAMVVNRPTNRLKRKLEAAKRLASGVVVTPDKLVYTTEEDLLDQDLSRLDPAP